MWHAIYQIALKLAEPLVRRRLRRRARHEPAYGERVEERFGSVPTDVPTGVVWFHTVSAGETIAAAPLIARLCHEFEDLPFLVTTMTPTGSQQVKQRLGEQVFHSYAPYDFAHGVEAFLQRTQPRLLVLMETELWPNLIAAAHQRQIPILLVNARLSEKSARGYARIGSLTRTMLSQLTAIACQDDTHRQRFIELGAAAEKTQTLGNLKFDHELPADYAEHLGQLFQQLPVAGRWIWIAASTHPGEEEQVLAAHRALLEQQPNALLILVPRHPVRASEVALLVQNQGLTNVRLSKLPEADELDPDALSVLIGDTMGQLGLLYGLAEVSFVGGSLVNHGGHNPIEPALCRCPILMGPSRRNFVSVCEAFVQANALGQVDDAASLGSALVRFAKKPDEASALGAAAQSVVESQRGAEARLLSLLRPQLREAQSAASA
ncbi:MAG: lipid IV(A) 3-deoxy-D-manno-octulosonic acid transferase [Pseudomonadales bacterium]